MEALVYEKKGKIYLKRKCPEHGIFDELYWESAEEFNRAKKYSSNARGLINTNVGITNNTGSNCPFDCGLCSNHHSHTALANIAVTNRCDLSCWYCFFYAKEGDPIYEPSVEQIRLMLRNLKSESPVPCNAVQFSVDHDQKIFLKDSNGIIFSKKIGEFVDEQMLYKKTKKYSLPINHERLGLSNYAVLTVDKNFNSVFKPINEIIRHENSEDLFEINASKGWSIIVTGSHSVFVLNDMGKIVEKKPGDLKINDVLVGSLTAPIGKNLSNVDLIELFLNSKDFDFLKDKIMISGIKKQDFNSLGKILGRRVNWDSIPLKDYVNLKKKVGDNLRYFNSKKEKAIPTKLELSNELARLLGYFAGEGCFYKNGLIFSFGLKEKKLIDDCISCIKKIFKDTNIRQKINHDSSLQIIIEGFLYKEVLKLLGCGSNAQNKKIPWVVFNAKDSFKKSFLKSYFECDGNVRMRKTGFEIVHNTVSKELASDLMLLHAQLGVVCQLNKSVSKPHLIKKTGQYIKVSSEKLVVSINGKENLSNSLWYLDGIEKKLFEDYCDSIEKHSPTYERLPVFNFIKNFSYKGINNKRITKIMKGVFFDKSISRSKLNELVLFFKQNNILFEKTCNHLSTTKSVGFFKIKKINKIKPSSKYVYDLSVPGSESFFTGSFGQLLAHNTGGEPTLREDLFEIIRVAKEEGFEHVQLNTTGMTIAFNKGYAQKLKKAGVSTLYVSFDGTTQKTNPKNHFEMPLTIEECRKAGLGIVLVPTLIKGVNDNDLANIIDFGLRNIDVVRGIDFQPVSFVGRMPKSQREKQRITIPRVTELLEKQSKKAIKQKDFFAIPCISSITNFIEALTNNVQYSLDNHFACGSATYVFVDEKNKKVIPLPEFVDVDGLFKFLRERATAIQNGKNKKIETAKLLLKIKSFINQEKKPSDLNLAKLLFDALVKHDYSALGKFHTKSLFIGMMHFMDPYNYDQQRVERCNIHYSMPDGRIVPFCAFNVVPELYRDKVQKQYSVSWEEFKQDYKGNSQNPLKKYVRNTKMLENNELYKKTYEKNKYLGN
ncbi:MAG: radical SAM protein [Candidatus ainarchaeum sp.]|nr:radical SAM protein [Candidatus ainarchaeum sp.]